MDEAEPTMTLSHTRIELSLKLEQVGTYLRVHGNVGGYTKTACPFV